MGKSKVKPAEEAAPTLSTLFASTSRDEGLEAIFAKTPVESLSNKRKRDEEVSRAKEAAQKIKALSLKKGKRPQRLSKPTSKSSKDDAEATSVVEEDVDDVRSDTSEDIQHESLRAASNKKRSKKPLQETPEEKALRDARTIFLANVPLICATSRSAKTALLSLITSHLVKISKEAKVESIRFRSLPLASALGKSAKEKEIPVEIPKENGDLNHARKRARAWSKRSNGAEDDDAEQPGKEETKFLTVAQKRKVAYITGKVQTDEKAKGGCNAYAVISNLSLTEQDAVLNSLVDSIQSVTFQDRILRTDRVTASGSKSHTLGNSKATVFVGGLDFEESEELLRKWIEGLIKAEKGDSKDYVEKVKIVRDGESGLGKGFAYVLLKDQDCVEELLALDASQLKLSKRKIRFEKCKSDAHMKAVSSLKTEKVVPKQAQKSKKPISRRPKQKIPQAEKDKLGEQLRDLPKEERKSIKASDVDRVARRLEKKQAKTAALKKQSRIAQAKKKEANGILNKVGKHLKLLGKSKAKVAGRSGKKGT